MFETITAGQDDYANDFVIKETYLFFSNSCGIALLWKSLECKHIIYGSSKQFGT